MAAIHRGQVQLTSPLKRNLTSCWSQVYCKNASQLTDAIKIIFKRRMCHSPSVFWQCTECFKLLNKKCHLFGHRKSSSHPCEPGKQWEGQDYHQCKQTIFLIIIIVILQLKKQTQKIKVHGQDHTLGDLHGICMWMLELDARGYIFNMVSNNLFLIIHNCKQSRRKYISLCVYLLIIVIIVGK